ncbi:MAG: hypothetical protein KA248_02230 [Kiritimatiellae bacterium]|nr:hypothetical protein [Kiritimatiellia bacterium]
MILRELRAARRGVDVAMFYINQGELVDALCFLASRQRIPVRLITDITMGAPAQRPLLEKLAQYGISVYLVQLPGGGKMHLKSLAMDDRLVITGTANWTQQAFGGNFEDTLIIRGEALARHYREQFESLIATAEDIVESSETTIRPPRLDYPRPSRGASRTPPDRVDAPRPNLFRTVHEVDAHFMPRPEVIVTLQDQLRRASNRVDLALFLINEPALVDTLEEIAREKRCRVRLLADHMMLDPGNLNVLHQLATAGVEVRVFGSDRESLHLKTAVIDDRHVWTGSANWTQGAIGLNVEDMLRFDSPDMARYYRSWLDSIAQVADPFVPVSLERSKVETQAALDASGYLVGLPLTGARTNWSDLYQHVDVPGFDVEAWTRYLPDEQFVSVLLDLIRTAHQSILISLYALPPRSSSEDEESLKLDVLQSLQEAASRGVYVRLLLYFPSSPQDRLYETHSEWAEELRGQGIDVRLGLLTLPFHEKIVVVDLCKVLIGSHNWSKGALSGERVYESSVLAVLPKQDIRLAEYLSSRPILSDMRSRAVWEQEAALIRRVISVSGSDRDELIRTLEEDAP